MDALPKSHSRLFAIDALRGAVMIVMALDHMRDFLHIGAMSFSPTDLGKTTPALFLTRWITHFCLPVFMFTAGMGAFLYGQRVGTKGQLSLFLWTRGIWLIVLELTVMRLAYNFNFSLRFPFLLLILWIFGVCMIVMAALIHLPIRSLAVLSVAIIALHNSLDGINASRFGAEAWLWNLVHQPGVFSFGGESILVSYPLLPWIALMAAGFCFGQVFLLEPDARRRITLRLGLALSIAFLIIRALNIYGDPVPWVPQRSVVFTVLSFLNCTKYPASLDFLLMTLGPALLILAYLDRSSLKAGSPLLVFGRVPLFYFILHFYAIHFLALLMAFIRYGKAALTFMFNPVPSMGGPRELFPADYGYSLSTVYVFWIFTVAALYPLCLWFARVKATRRNWWLSYL